MAYNFFDTLKNSKSLENYCDSVRQGIPLAVFGVPESFKYLLSSVIDFKVLLIEKDTVSSLNALKSVKEFSGKKAVYIPPKDETILKRRAFSKDSYFNRICAIEKIPESDIIIGTAESFMGLFPKSVSSITVKTGEADLQKIVDTLIIFGYRREDKTSEKGSFSVRGDILDVFPIDRENPVRFDFFGDEIESIKEFDVESGENLGFIKEVKIICAVEFTFSDDDKKDLLNAMEEEVNNAQKDKRVRLKTLYEDLSFAIDNFSAVDMEILAPLSKDARSIFDLIPKDTVIIFDEAKRANEILDLFIEEFSKRHQSLLDAGETFSFTENSVIKKDEFIKNLSRYRNVSLSTISTAIPYFNPLKIIDFKSAPASNYRFDIKEFYNDAIRLRRQNYKVVAYTGDVKRAEMLALDLSKYGISYSIDKDGEGVIIISKELSAGFILHDEKLAVIGSGNLYFKSIKDRKIRVKKQSFFTAPTAGDYCVHEIHGVGRVLGDKKITSTEGTKDYISVEYSGGDILYVPVEQMDILSRYLGSEKKPKLSKIGGKDFERIKERARESIKKMSFDLKALYSAREKEEGFKFFVDTELKGLFNDAFSFSETADQETAEKEILSDMQSGKVMDRLVCGDVGFGKTEVAFRAAFVAISNGKQVAMLAPTTILTEQHYNTAIKRFSNFGVKIACLNRFRSKKEQNAIVEKLKAGEIDFVIGTHRLLSSDIGFKDLGLLILDEEQRFGVEHKEKIKLLKKNVDTVTLTATPIPRTLHLSLSGIRSISTINTPPQNRLPVQTYVTEENENLIKDAIEREINRGGQAFILYNRIESIFTFAERIKLIMPKVKLTVIHGRMDEKVLEESIMAFYRGESDLLISTTIIENGIDLPKANTLIVIDADLMGLSTLYQLKGRVGRSDRLAYAYFTYKREKILSETAYERLNAITEFAEMGSGIKIAMRDLEIRGAGNVLGAEQHGHMDKIGYELYSKLLREELSGETEIQPELDIRVNGFIPENYIESTSARMDTYKEIAEIDSLSREKEFINNTEDAFGELPIEVINLINIALVKFFASKIKATGITVNKDSAYLSFGSFNAFSDVKLRMALDEFSGETKISMSKIPKIEFLRQGESNEDMLTKIRKFLEVTVK